MASAVPVQAVDWLPAVLMTAGVVVLGVVFTATIRGRLARRRNATPDPHEMIDRLKEQAAARHDFGEAEARYLDTTRRLAAQLDNKTRMLQQLIADADDRIATLRATSAPAPKPMTRAAPTREPATEDDPLKRSIYALADAGRTPTAIARELDEPIGKVELILALRATRAS